MKSDIINLTKKLISIPSWVDDTTDESQLAEFIYSYLKENSNLKLTKQTILGKRFNILAQNSQEIKTLVIGHMDTVGISGGWTLDPLAPTIKNGRLYGLGATDMKSGLAAMLIEACSPSLAPNSAFLFYIDEEYSFLGMKRFLEAYSGILPQTVVSLDGSELEVGNGCRGLIEINLTIQGKSCHAATPQNGVNAIVVAVQAVEELKTLLSSFPDPELGTTTINLASLTGGVKDKNGIRQSTPNLVPDLCQLTLDIRPSNTKITADFVVKNLNKILLESGASITSSTVNFNFGCWLTPRSYLSSLRYGLKDIQNSGYIDIQLLWASLGRPLCLTIGAGAQSMAHSPDEYIEVIKLKQLPKMLQQVLLSLS